MQENDAVSYTKSDYWTKICRNLTTAKAYSRYAVYLFFILLDFRLWRCWLGGRKGIRPVKKWVVGRWRGYLSGVRCRLAYSPTDATATSLSLAPVKSRLVLPFWYWLTWVVPEKRPLNGCVCVCVYVYGDVKTTMAVTSHFFKRAKIGLFCLSLYYRHI